MAKQLPPQAPPAGGEAIAVLGEIEAAIRAQVKPQHAEQCEEAMVNAEKILYDAQMNKDLLSDMGRMTVNDPQKVAVGIMGLMTLMRAEEAMRFPDEIMAPVASLAGVSLIRFMAESGMAEPNTEFIGNVFEELYAVLMQKFDIGRGDLEGLAQERAQKATALDPNNPEQLIAQQPTGLINGAMA